MYVPGAYGWYVGSEGLRTVFIENRLSNLLLLQPFHIMQPGSEHRDGLSGPRIPLCNVVYCSILKIKGLSSWPRSIMAP